MKVSSHTSKHKTSKNPYVTVCFVISAFFFFCIGQVFTINDQLEERETLTEVRDVIPSLMDHTFIVPDDDSKWKPHADQHLILLLITYNNLYQFNFFQSGQVASSNQLLDGELVDARPAHALGEMQNEGDTLQDPSFDHPFICPEVDSKWKTDVTQMIFLLISYYIHYFLVDSNIQLLDRELLVDAQPAQAEGEHLDLDNLAEGGNLKKKKKAHRAKPSKRKRTERRAADPTIGRKCEFIGK